MEQKTDIYINKSVEYRKNNLLIRFSHPDKKCFYEIVDQVKTLPGKYFDQNIRGWYVPITLDTVRNLKSWGFVFCSKLEKWYLSQITKKGNKNKIHNNFNDSILYDYQQPHAKQLICSLLENNAALDASETGTGKTFVALAIAKYLKLFPIVITPKTVIPSWKKAAKLFEIDCYVKNYEQFRLGKTPYLNMKKIISETLKKGEKIKEEKIKFKWSANKKTILIWDECHRTKNYKSQNSLMLDEASNQNCKILALSATVADNPLHVYSLGKALKLFSNKQDFWKWAFNRGVRKGYFGMEFKAKPEHLQKIHNDIFPGKGSRISIKELGDKFPKNLIISECYDMSSNAKQIQKIYDEMHKELRRLKKLKKKDGSSVLTEILRARQQIELLKIPALIEMTNDLVEEGNSVVIFVNFKESIKALSKRLKTNCIVDGSIVGEDRQKNIDLFQADTERIILCNTQAGGVGISLHDLHGNHPRISLISPTNSAQDLKQCLGRTPRAGAKTPVIQKIIFCADTVEEQIAENIENKINRINTINDGDLMEKFEIITNKGA